MSEQTLEDLLRTVVSEEVQCFIEDQARFEISKVASDAVIEAMKKANFETFQEINRMFEVDGLIKQLEELPTKIFEYKQDTNDLRSSIRTKRQALTDLDQQIKEIETNILLNITEETDENGKKKFSNDKARQAELNRRKKEDPDYIKAHEDYQSLKNNIEDLEDYIADNEAKMKKLEMEFQSCCKIFEVTTAQMNIYAQVCGKNVKELPSMDGISSIENKNQEEGEW